MKTKSFRHLSEDQEFMEIVVDPKHISSSEKLPKRLLIIFLISVLRSAVAWILVTIDMALGYELRA